MAKFVLKMSFIFLSFLTIQALAYAGSIYNFANLGFSPSGHYFAFADYGINTWTHLPESQLYVVDTQKNNFVPHGIYQGLYVPKNLHSQQFQISGMAALLQATKDCQTLLDRYDIQFFNTGRLLYLYLDSLPNTDKIHFFDYKTHLVFAIQLHQNQWKTSSGESSSFTIELTLKNKKAQTLYHTIIGLPHFKRLNVIHYNIRQILLSANSHYIVFVVEKTIHHSSGNSYQDMIETAPLPNLRVLKLK